jgi:hypothetical protein
MTQSAHWKKTALDAVPDPQQHAYIVGSIVAGTLTAGASTLLSGVLLTLLGSIYAYRRGEKAAKFDEAIEQHGVIAPALRKDALKDYVTEVGIHQAVSEIKWAEENGYPTTDCAIELLESYQLPIDIPVSESQAPKQIPTASISPQNFIKTSMPETLLPLQPRQSTTISQSLVERIVSKPEHLLGIGASESGKGILFSNMAVALKAKYDCILVVIDPKGDPNEVRFFDGVADRVHRFRASKLTPDEVIASVKEGWSIVEEEFDKWEGIKPVYVFIDEMVFIGTQFSQKRDNFLNDKIAAIVTMGKSLQQFVWIATQYPGIEELGIKGGIAAQMTKIIIGRDEHMEMLEGWRGYKLTKDVDFRAAIVPMRKSPVKRAIWYKGEWLSMEIMAILSGFCRQTGKHVGLPPIEDKPVVADSSPNRQITESTDSVLNRAMNHRIADESGSVVTEPDSVPNQQVEDLSIAIMEYFGGATSLVPKGVRDIKAAHRIKSFGALTDSGILSALNSLVASGKLVTPMPAYWSLPSWL